MSDMPTLASVQRTFTPPARAGLDFLTTTLVEKKFPTVANETPCLLSATQSSSVSLRTVYSNEGG